MSILCGYYYQCCWLQTTRNRCHFPFLWLKSLYIFNFLHKRKTFRLIVKHYREQSMGCARISILASSSPTHTNKRKLFLQDDSYLCMRFFFCVTFLLSLSHSRLNVTGDSIQMGGKKEKACQDFKSLFFLFAPMEKRKLKL